MLVESGALGGQFSCQHCDGECRRNAVFVWRVTWVNGITDGLFVTENQVLNLGNPLEPGQCLLELEAVFGGYRCQRRARNDRARNCSFSTSASGRGGRGVTQDETHLVTG